MKTAAGATIALAAILGCHVGQAAAQTPSSVAQMAAGGEWALGRWEGNLTGVGSSGGATQSPRTLIIEKNGAGIVTCLWFITNDPNSQRWTEGCTIGQKDITLETSARSSVELSRSGQNSLQGKFKGAGAAAANSGLSTTYVHMNRVQ
jgi:hypothetical protein